MKPNIESQFIDSMSNTTTFQLTVNFLTHIIKFTKGNFYVYGNIDDIF